jgi:ketosteroid isomerase-like protein
LQFVEGLRNGVGGLFTSMANENEMRDAEIIRRLIADQHNAICRKDIDGIMNCYAADAVIFNAKPPYQIRDRENWRDVWGSSLSHFPAAFSAETRDLAIDVSGDLAVAYYLLRFTEMPGNLPWIRETVVYRKIGGAWQIVHEHSSAPFDPHTLKVVLESD